MVDKFIAAFTEVLDVADVEWYIELCCCCHEEPCPRPRKLGVMMIDEGDGSVGCCSDILFTRLFGEAVDRYYLITHLHYIYYLVALEGSLYTVPYSKKSTSPEIDRRFAIYS